MGEAVGFSGWFPLREEPVGIYGITLTNSKDGKVG
jgi:hypothetical protein